MQSQKYIRWFTIRIYSRKDRNYQRNDSQRYSSLFFSLLPFQAMTKCWLNVKCWYFNAGSCDSFSHLTLEQLINFLSLSFDSLFYSVLVWLDETDDTYKRQIVMLILFESCNSTTAKPVWNTPIWRYECVYLCVRIRTMTLKCERSIRFRSFDLNFSWERFSWKIFFRFFPFIIIMFSRIIILFDYYHFVFLHT